MEFQNSPEQPSIAEAVKNDIDRLSREDRTKGVAFVSTNKKTCSAILLKQGRLERKCFACRKFLHHAKQRLPNLPHCVSEQRSRRKGWHAQDLVEQVQGRRCVLRGRKDVHLVSHCSDYYRHDRVRR